MPGAEYPLMLCSISYPLDCGVGQLISVKEEAAKIRGILAEKVISFLLTDRSTQNWLRRNEGTTTTYVQQQMRGEPTPAKRTGIGACAHE